MDEQKEARAIEQKLQDARLFDMDFHGSNALAQYELYKAAGARGLWNGLTGLANLAWDVLNGAGSLMYELALRSNPITAPIKFQQDLQALKAAHQELQQFADEDLELYAALMSDEDTHKMLKDFANDYLAAQHSLEYAETGGQVLFDILLTLVTAGFGAAASARHLAKLKKLKPLLQKLAKLLKRKRFKTSKKGTHDSRIESKITIKSDRKLDKNIKKKINTPKPSLAEVKLAKTFGKTPEHINARNKVSRYYLENNGFSKDQIKDALGNSDGSIIGGIDLEKPVEVISFPPPELMRQYVKSHGYPGNWFDPKNNQTADSLGISDEGRKAVSLKMPNGNGLLSYSKPILDKWTNPGNPIQTKGGGQQIFINNSIREEIIKINKIGEQL